MGRLWNFFKRPIKNRVINKLSTNTLDSLFDELEDVFIKKDNVSHYYLELKSRYEELERYSSLTNEDIEKLDKLVAAYKEIDEKKQSLRGRLIKNNKGLVLVAKHEEEIPKLIEEMIAEEAKVKDTETDLYYLQEEKEQLIEERELLIKGYNFLKWFSFTLIGILAFSLVVAFAFMQILREGIWVYLSIFSLILVILLSVILVAKDKLEKRLKENEILQQKAVKYINKVKVKLFNQKSYLNFQYDKVGVDSSAKLEMYFNRYLKNKDNEKKYAYLNHQLMDIEDSIMALFHNRGIHMDHVENLTDWVMAGKKASDIDAVKTEMEKTKQQLDALSEYEQELWKQVYILKEDSSLSALVNEKINYYMEVTKVYLDKQNKDK